MKLSDFVTNLSLVRVHDVVRDGSLRMATPFQYPDGSLIDVFLKDTRELFEGFELSDKGQTMAYLMDLHVKPWTSQKRRQTLADICEALGVEIEGGTFRIRLGKSDMVHLPDAIVRLAQACIRVADIAFTQRLRTPAALSEDFEEFLVGLDRPYRSNVLIPGQFGKDVEFNFQVQGQRVISLVQILSTPNRFAAHSLSVEAFARWSDIAPVRASYQCLSVFDTTNDVFREDDLRRLESVSEVVGFPAESDRLNFSLAA